jgi:hypothetical protein
MGSHPGLFGRVVSPDHVRGKREALEILDVQLPITLSRRKLIERLMPRPTRESASGSLFSIRDRHWPSISSPQGYVTASQRTRNRVTVFERRPGGTLYIPAWDPTAGARAGGGSGR